VTSVFAGIQTGSTADLDRQQPFVLDRPRLDRKVKRRAAVVLPVAQLGLARIGSIRQSKPSEVLRGARRHHLARCRTMRSGSTQY